MDQSIVHWVNSGWANPTLDLLMSILSSRDFWTPFLVLAGLAFAIFGGIKGRFMVLSACLAVGVVDGVIVHTVKRTIGRPRPFMVIEGIRQVDLAKTTPAFLGAFEKPTIEISKPWTGSKRSGSFPSGHSSNNFALAAVVIAYYRRWGWLILPLSAGIAISRVYVGMHWFSDIVVGAFLGAGIALLLVVLIDWLWTRWSNRIFPKAHSRCPSLLL